MKMTRGVQKGYEAYLRAIGHSPDDARALTLQRWEEITAIENKLLKKGYRSERAHDEAIEQWEFERDRNPNHREKVFRWMR